MMCCSRKKNSSWIFQNVFPLLLLAAKVVGSYTATYKGENYPDVYQGEQGNLTCRLAVPTSAHLTNFGYITSNKDSSDNVVTRTCSVTYNGPDVQVIGMPTSLTEVCSMAYYGALKTKVVHYVVLLTIGSKMKYFCYMTSSKSNNLVTGNPFIISKLLVAPKSLTIQVTPKTVYAGYEVSINCISKGGYPPAVLDYVADGQNLGSNYPQFIANAANNNKKYSCKDLSHPNYNDGVFSTTYQELHLTVYYLIVLRKSVRLVLDPTTNSIDLQCLTTYNLPQQTDISYQWTKDREAIAQSTLENTIQIKRTKLTNVDEEYHCIATIVNDRTQKIRPVKTQFLVQWKVKNSTIGETTLDPSLTYMWILPASIAVIAVVLPISVLLIIVLAVRRHKRKVQCQRKRKFSQKASKHIYQKLQLPSQ